MSTTPSRGQVFINCPFDSTYDDKFHAIVFAVMRCGFRSRCAREVANGAQVRIEKIMDIIDDCQLGIHDISFTELDSSIDLPRFNMPFELGLDLGARRFAAAVHGDKSILILDREPYRYEKYISDIKGQDVVSHEGSVDGAIGCVRDFLNSYVHNVEEDPHPIESKQTIAEEYALFTKDLPAICAGAKLTETDLDYLDFLWAVKGWLTP